MKNPNQKFTKTPDLNEDPITGEPGAHPVSTGVGAAGAGAIGTAIGSVVGGPVGGVVGAAVGAIVGGLGGSAMGEVIDPSGEKPLPGVPADTMATGLDDDLAASLTNDPLITPMSGTGEVINSVPTDEDIAARAWMIYEAEGRPEGRADEHWLRAERELAR